MTPALLADMGWALRPAFLAWPLLQSGQLQTVMEEWQADPMALHIPPVPHTAGTRAGLYRLSLY